MKYIQFQKNTPLQYITLPSNLSTATCHEPIHFRNPTPSSDTKPHPTVLYRCCACPSPFSGRSGFPLPPFDCRCVRAECFRCSVSSCSSTKSNVSLSSAFPPPMTYIPNESQTKHCERMCVTKKVLEWLATNQTSGCQPPDREPRTAQLYLNIGSNDSGDALPKNYKCLKIISIGCHQFLFKGTIL